MDQQRNGGDGAVVHKVLQHQAMVTKQVSVIAREDHDGVTGKSLVFQLVQILPMCSSIMVIKPYWAAAACLY